MDRPAARTLALLELPTPVQSHLPLKSPSFYKTRKAYVAPVNRRTRRSAYAALLLLVGLAVYFFVFPSAWAPTPEVRVPRRMNRIVDVNIEEHQHIDVHHYHHYHQPSASSRLSAQQQLAALTSFILSPLHSNSLAQSSEDDFRIEDLLEFSLDSPRAEDMLEEMVKETWNNEKVVVFGKHHHPPTRMLKNLLKVWEYPKPSIIELDKRQDGSVLESVLKRLALSTIEPRDTTSTTDNANGDDVLALAKRAATEDHEWSLPLLLIRGQPIFGLANIKRLQQEGHLDALLSSS